LPCCRPSRAITTRARPQETHRIGVPLRARPEPGGRRVWLLLGQVLPRPGWLREGGGGGCGGGGAGVGGGGGPGVGRCAAAGGGGGRGGGDAGGAGGGGGPEHAVGQ